MNQSVETEVHDPPARAAFASGQAVEIWNRYTSRWTGGFAVHDRVGDGYRVVRPGDVLPIPHVFAADAMRPAR